MSTERLSRRRFLAGLTATCACGSMFLPRVFVRSSSAAGRAVTDKAGQPMEYRTLGRTGLKVSAVSFGAMRVTEPALLYEAMEKGINYFDTAHKYQNGNNEVLLGQVLKQFGRDKVYVATKVPPYYKQSLGMLLRSRESMQELLETSLKRLQTDYVDVLFLHNIKEPGWALHDDLMGFAAAAKKSGKARFIGISFHADGQQYVDIARSALQTDLYDVYLASLNFKSPPSHLDIIRTARRRNIGIVAMKTQAGGYAAGAASGLNPHQAALRWVLDHDFVDCAIPGMVSREQLQENIAAPGRSAGWSDRKRLHAYYQAVKDRLCCRCGGCAGSCPAGVAIADINRALMYYEGYGDAALGRAAYAELGFWENAQECRVCTDPTCSCVNGITLAERMRYAHALFA